MNELKQNPLYNITAKLNYSQTFLQHFAERLRTRVDTRSAKSWGWNFSRENDIEIFKVRQLLDVFWRFSMDAKIFKSRFLSKMRRHTLKHSDILDWSFDLRLCNVGPEILENQSNQPRSVYTVEFFVM